MLTETDLRPVAPEARLLQLDVLRGLALFGVLLVNLDVFSGSMWALEAKLPYPMGWGGSTLTFLVKALLEGKAAALLALLFGAGLAIQFEGARRKERSYTPTGLRRIGALALFGLAHSFLLWNLDILLDYALISLMMLPFLRIRPGRILWAIPLLLGVSLLIALPFLSSIRQEPNPDWFYRMGLQHYGAGSWLGALKYRSWELVHFIGPDRLTSRPLTLLPFFVLGVYFWKKGFLSDPEKHFRTLRVLALVCLVLGLLSNLIPQDALKAWAAGIPFRPLRILIKLTAFFARPTLTLGYAAGILLLLRRPWWRTIMSPFAPLGRMALTQYLLQSVVCTWVFNGHGLGLYGKVSVSACVLGGIVLFAIQVWSSRLWLERYAMGPAEWLWRRMTYSPGRFFNGQHPAPSPLEALSPQERP